MTDPNSVPSNPLETRECNALESGQLGDARARSSWQLSLLGDPRREIFLQNWEQARVSLRFSPRPWQKRERFSATSPERKNLNFKRESIINMFGLLSPEPLVVSATKCTQVR